MVKLSYYPDYSLKYQTNKKQNGETIQQIGGSFLKGDIISFQILKNIYNMNRFAVNLGLGLSLNKKTISIERNNIRYTIVDTMNGF